MWWYNRVMMPLGVRFQKKMSLQPGMIDGGNVDEVLLLWPQALEADSRIFFFLSLRFLCFLLVQTLVSLADAAGAACTILCQSARFVQAFPMTLR